MEGRGHWLKALGHAQAPLPAAWIEDGAVRRLTRAGFPRHPRMEPGDRLVYHASVWRRVFAIVHPVSERRPWAVAVEPLLVVPRLDDAPPVEAIGVLRRVRRNSAGERP